MTEYLAPLFSLLLAAMATLACIRFIFSRQGLFWIVPLLVSIILTLAGVTSLFGLAGPLPLLAQSPILSLMLSFFWYLVVISFHYALKKKVYRNSYLNDMRKNLNEARFLEKNERREFTRRRQKRREEALNSYYKPTSSDFTGYDLSIFD